uniref:Dynamin GTPase domain-containing protein n=1 Tax=Nelumbo nucifera TaxID=4432 RepID=A0A822XZE8_NELNU|nr:TPA_asm: hypothetical protein HUJ06_026055 [Nelumbo nucifera]
MDRVSINCKTTCIQEKMTRFGLREEDDELIHDAVPLYSTYSDQIRPLLDTVDQLCHLKTMKEGIELPTIVIIGDQSSSKSSVLESRTGISLPQGIGICTRVPLVMYLQHHSATDPELYLEYHDKKVDTNETHVRDAIAFPMVKKKGIIDLTMVDLPGITRVPILGQPQDIYEQISNIIMESITPKECIILNVLQLLLISQPANRLECLSALIPPARGC